MGNNTWHDNNQGKQIQYGDGNRNIYQSYNNNSNNYRGSDNNPRKQIQYNNNSYNYRGRDNNNRKQIQYNNNDYNMNIEEIIEEKVDSTKNIDDNDFNVNNLSGDMLNDKDNAFMTTLKVNDICKSTQLTNGPINKASVKLHLRSDAQPKIIPPRRIPYSKIDLVSNELKKWIHDKIIEPVNDVRWASPITLQR
ncbi:putative uncharacterized protein DDB_G0285557 [Gordionus sp. m RMFG-2023]|uniref:putative uncharacterized protein DDB_G0285557 n=1 Tax=Gordionus sp. m RMFG-2023 TaxID=3053472 RepID=UPI0031FD2BA8